MLSQTNIMGPIQLASLNSIWTDFVVRDNSPRINILQYAISNVNEFFEPRIIQSRTWPIWLFQTHRTLQKLIEGEISF